jgi:hypothetical protein
MGILYRLTYRPKAEIKGFLTYIFFIFITNLFPRLYCKLDNWNVMNIEPVLLPTVNQVSLMHCILGIGEWSYLLMGGTCCGTKKNWHQICGWGEQLVCEHWALFHHPRGCGECEWLKNIQWMFCKRVCIGRLLLGNITYL